MSFPTYEEISAYVADQIRTGAIAERFWALIKRAGPDECWLWQGDHTREGYGRLSFRLRGRKTWRVASRVAYELTNGAIPDGQKVLHHCDNPPCCNPSHHFLGSDLDNRADAVAKGRHKWPTNPRRTQCSRGHPFDEKNTRVTIDPKRGRRIACRECDRIRSIPKNAARNRAAKLARSAA